MKSNSIRSAAVAATLVAFAAWPARAAEEATIAIDNFTFTPAELTVKAGTKMLFVNHDDIPHSVVVESRRFPLEGVGYGRQLRLRLRQAGRVRLFLRPASADEGQDQGDALMSANGET